MELSPKDLEFIDVMKSSDNNVATIAATGIIILFLENVVTIIAMIKANGSKSLAKVEPKKNANPFIFLLRIL